MRLAMLEPLIGLAVAVALGVYLVVTLLRPERF
ncbi:K(+)-transporting ATPase subunit F [Pseudomonas sp. R2.Fl]|nr:K(+)-transporting ATPase subunit F [Pseudomonas sp. R2.Fl]